MDTLLIRNCIDILMKSVLLVFVTLSLCFLNQEVPFKPSDEFEVKLDYKFKERPPVEKPDYQAPTTSIAQKASGPLPYLRTDIILKVQAAEEIRLRVINSDGITVANRKISSNEVIKIDWGFTEDVKDRISSHQYTIQFLNSDKKPVSQIVLIMEEDGTLLVNNSKRGKL